MRNPLKLEWCNEAENDKPCQQGAVWVMNEGVSILLLKPCYRSTAVKIATQVYYIKQHSWVTWEKHYKAKDHGRNTLHQSMMGNKGMIFLWMVCGKKNMKPRLKGKISLLATAAKVKWLNLVYVRLLLLPHDGTPLSDTISSEFTMISNLEEDIHSIFSLLWVPSRAVNCSIDCV